MCGHVFRTINDVRVCLRCGMTINLIDGSVTYDRELQSQAYRKKKGRKRK